MSKRKLEQVVSTAVVASLAFTSAACEMSWNAEQENRIGEHSLLEGVYVCANKRDLRAGTVDPFLPADRLSIRLDHKKPKSGNEITDSVWLPLPEKVSDEVQQRTESYRAGLEDSENCVFASVKLPGVNPNPATNQVSALLVRLDYTTEQGEKKHSLARIEDFSGAVSLPSTEDPGRVILAVSGVELGVEGDPLTIDAGENVTFHDPVVAGTALFAMDGPENRDVIDETERSALVQSRAEALCKAIGFTGAQGHELMWRTSVGNEDGSNEPREYLDDSHDIQIAQQKRLQLMTADLKTGTLEPRGVRGVVDSDLTQVGWFRMRTAYLYAKFSALTCAKPASLAGKTVTRSYETLLFERLSENGPEVAVDTLERPVLAVDGSENLENDGRAEEVIRGRADSLCRGIGASEAAAWTVGYIDYRGESTLLAARFDLHARSRSGGSFEPMAIEVNRVDTASDRLEIQPLPAKAAVDRDRQVLSSPGVFRHVFCR